MVRSHLRRGPCTMAPPYDLAKLKDVFEKKDHVMKQLET